ncbi:MAG: ThuA domain-containing protein [Lachnospiraceae bacterium]|nr:ThuA domain-containing protein [Lachnospiraceae bacterium]
MINVTIWNENIHERQQEEVRAIYPTGIHGCIAQFLSRNEDIKIHLATFDEPEHGLTQDILDNTDVLVYWSHMAQEEFSDVVAERIHQAVLNGMGLVALHSAHASKMMKKLLGTTMTLKWRHNDRERLIVTAPAHPIASAVPEYIELPVEEMYGEYFDIPKPDDVVFTGWFAGGEVFRSGCTFTRGLGKIFYFQPGHEAYPIYHDRNIQRIITNAVYWCAPGRRIKAPMECLEITTSPEKLREAQLKSDSEPESSGGIRLSVFYDHLREAAGQTGRTFEELLAEAHRAGISGVEMEYSTLEQKPELDRIIKNADMEISNLYHFFDFGHRYAQDMQTGRKMIDTARTLGIERVMIIPGFLSPDQVKLLNKAGGSYEETEACMNKIPEILAMRDAIAGLTEYAAQYDIMVSIEDFDAYDSPIARINHIRWFLTQIPDLKHTLDMGNYCFSNENVEEAYELFKDRIGHVHCKDRGQEQEDESKIRENLGIPCGEKLVYRRGLRPVPVGDGYIPIAELVHKLRKQGYRGYLAIEHFGSPNQLGYMLKSAKFLKALL